MDFIVYCTIFGCIVAVKEQGVYKKLLDSNGRLQATWHGKAASLVFQPYAFAFVVFRILSVTKVQRFKGSFSRDPQRYRHTHTHRFVLLQST